ncbi:MAG: aromatic-ring-hydroxylating dioxygenase subunit beta [Parvularcula sp.]|jgi:benzoate/toluate 1,2-dioxygenase beta subunit|nr:aromatic-ring-hydroxylating dioxygenase subunit beta [Parvularcula sp.]
MTLIERVEAFLVREADLLDDQAWDDWLSLCAEDFRYWMPVERSLRSPQEGVSHIYDDHPMMAARLHRLANPRGFAAEPAPSTLRLVGSISAETMSEHIIARSKLILLEHRDRDRFETDVRTFAARQTHTLIEEEDGFRIRMKRVDLLGAEGSFNALAVPF